MDRELHPDGGPGRGHLASIEIVAARQSGRDGALGELHQLSFVKGLGVNTPAAFALTCERLLEAAAETGREVGAYVLMMVIAEGHGGCAGGGEFRRRPYQPAPRGR